MFVHEHLHRACRLYIFDEILTSSPVAQTVLIFVPFAASVGAWRAHRCDAGVAGVDRQR